MAWWQRSKDEVTIGMTTKEADELQRIARTVERSNLSVHECETLNAFTVLLLNALNK